MVSWLVKQGNYIVKCSVISSVNLISPAFAVQMFGFSVNRRAIKTAIFCHFSHVLPFAQIAHPVFVHFAHNPHPVRMACQTLHNAPQAPQRSGYAPALPASAPALLRPLLGLLVPLSTPAAIRATVGALRGLWCILPAWVMICPSSASRRILCPSGVALVGDGVPPGCRRLCPLTL